ncbi:MAG: SIMPL domain-containing protein [Kiritimatiellae bacterium]|nr:SIMPL domain-containing protein [Kiritimatiellia bacterium]
MRNVFRFSVAAVIFALGMTASSLVLSKLLIRIRHEQAITVKGFAQRDVMSDIGRFCCTVSARGVSLKEAYEKLQESRQAVLAYLKQAGFQQTEVTPETIKTTRVMKRDAEGNETNEIECYDASQDISVSSSNVTAIQKTATGITELIKEGVDISAAAPEYYVSDLKNLKMTLLAEATRDGHRRAQMLAENSGGRVGSLIAARQGVFQITKRHSTETSDYGMYDTSTPEKTVKAIVTLEYQIGQGP